MGQGPGGLKPKQGRQTRCQFIHQGRSAGLAAVNKFPAELQKPAVFAGGSELCTAAAGRIFGE